jgi:hypothetical protein
MLRPTMQELLSIEKFCQRKFYKIKTKFLKEIRASFGAIGNPLMSGFLEGNFVTFRL